MQWNEGQLSLAENTRPILKNEPVDKIFTPLSSSAYSHCASCTLGGSPSVPGARRASFLIRAPPVAF